MSNSNNIYNILGKLDALKPTPEEKRMSLVKEIQESVEAQGSILSGVDAVQAKLARQFAESVAEVAPPGDKAERMVKGIKKSLSKDGHLSGKDKAIAYATTWKAHNKGQVEEAYNPVKAVKQCAKSTMEMNGIASVHDLDAEDIEYIGDECHMSYQDVCEILGIQLPDGLGPVKSWDTDEQGNKFDLEEGVCAKCGMNEGSCEHTMAEAEITRTDGKTTHRKTDFPGYPVDEPEDIEDENKGKRGRPRKHAAKAPTGLGRGRPTKPKAPTYSKQADPFSRISGAVPKGAKGTVHSMGEAMTQLKLNLDSMQLNEGRYLEDSAKETLQHVLSRFRSEVRSFEQGNELDKDLYDALFDYYSETGEMPYGVQKARTGDPYNWVAEHLDAELGNLAYGSDPANAEGAGLEMEAGIPGNLPAEQIPGKEDLLKGKGRSYYEEEVTMEDELNELARLAGVQTEGNAFSGKLAHTAKGSSFEQDGKTFTNRSSIADESAEEEGSPQADQDYDKDGEVESEKDEVIGSRRKAAGLDESTSFDGAEQSDFNISTSMSSDGDKNVTVTATGEHAASLLQMLRIAGLGGGQAAQDLEQQQEPEIVVFDEPDAIEMEEEGVEVDHPSQEPANAPHETYGSIKNITTQGDDLNREKSQDPATANKAANPMTNAQRTLKAVAALESKLAEEYESIKKISK